MECSFEFMMLNENQSLSQEFQGSVTEAEQHTISRRLLLLADLLQLVHLPHVGLFLWWLFRFFPLLAQGFLGAILRFLQYVTFFKGKL